MGSWFSNLHIQKSERVTEAAIFTHIRNYMTAQHYLPVTNQEEADASFAVISAEGSQWYSVYSDLFSFDEPKMFTDYAAPMSSEFATDILGIACFDSDYLFLNLLNTEKKVDAWAGVGSAAGLGIRKRTNLSAWKQSVDDYNGFKESLKRKYVFAEEVLAEIEPCIHLPQNFATASYEYLADLGLGETATHLYFKLPQEATTQELPKLEPQFYSLMPCFLHKSSSVGAKNVGGVSKGLSVYFLGPYVEHDEITFSDVSFVRFKKNNSEDTPIQLQKVQLKDGQWAYHYHDPGFRIPPKIDERLPFSKQLRLSLDRSFFVRFTPHGNPRKILDISVVLVPDKNPEGQTGWNVWQYSGSKKAFIDEYNQRMRNIPNSETQLLREEDFD